MLSFIRISCMVGMSALSYTLLNSLETAIDHDNYLEFQQVLSDIGEALEARFVLEDKLILLVLDAARVKHPA